MSEIQLLENIEKVYKKIEHAARTAGRSPEDVKLVAVTKNVDSNLIRKAVEIGLREFGENRIQEARDKISNLQSQVNPLSHPLQREGDGGLQHIPQGREDGFRIKWHMVGHLQKNKTKIAVQLFDLIHSVDSIELAEEINKHAEKIGKIQRIIIQVKLSDEETKHGIINDKLLNLFGELHSMRNLKTEGLMTIPPFFEDPESSRSYFARLREIRDSLEVSGYKTQELSMGMSNDFEVAINEGATMVRIGTALFGERITI
jgi:pyridoxal phosphate enzyme (YggS family)